MATGRALSTGQRRLSDPEWARSSGDWGLPPRCCRGCAGLSVQDQVGGGGCLPTLVGHRENEVGWCLVVCPAPRLTPGECSVRAGYHFHFPFYSESWIQCLVIRASLTDFSADPINSCWINSSPTTTVPTINSRSCHWGIRQRTRNFAKHTSFYLNNYLVRETSPAFYRRGNRLRDSR